MSCCRCGLCRHQAELYRWSGWPLTLGFHYVMDDLEADYVIDAVDFVGQHGHLFTSLYAFDLRSGAWIHERDPGVQEQFSLNDALRAVPQGSSALAADVRSNLYARHLQEAHQWIWRLKQNAPKAKAVLEGDLAALQFFCMPYLWTPPVLQGKD